MIRSRVLRAGLTGLVVLLLGGAATAQQTQLLWGDTHLHSNNSFDAFLNRNMSADPATAYRYAQGLPVIHPLHRARVQIETPLDFLVVADHAEYLGVMRHILERGIPKSDLSWREWFTAFYVEWWLAGVVEDDEGMSAFSSFLPDSDESVEEAAARRPAGLLPGAGAMSKTVWQEAILTADEFNRPGAFTTLIGWEWSSIPAGANLHRVVFTSAAADLASQWQPISSVDSAYPEDLWSWLDETAARTGAQFVAIPHNSNISKGYMFTDTTLRGAPYTQEIAEQRLRWEPVAEITQFKGDSETDPAVSPDDPFADFETYPHYIQQNAPEYDPKPGDFVRAALRLGLDLEQRVGANPYRFGLIGSTDSHTGLSSAEEPNFWGKFPRDSIPEAKQSGWRTGGDRPGPNGWSMSASGLAAVWATENTREAILDAFRRKEVYATTGPRIGLRLFAGWNYQAADAHVTPIERIGYSMGVPMGGDLLPGPSGGAPKLLIHAQKDPIGANLDRLQVVKGWIDAQGETHERVYDVAASGARRAGPGGLPAVGNTVDPETGRYTNDIGAPALATVWQDPDFDPRQAAFYYVRVLQIPTPRHSLFDALALGMDPAETGHPTSIQERAYSSPIWYRP